MKLEITEKEMRKTITWRLNTMLLKKQWVNEEMKNYLVTNDSENTTIQNLGDAAKPVLGGSLSQYSPSLQNKNLNLTNHLKELQTKQSQQKKGKNKDQRGIEIKKRTKTNKSKSSFFERADKIDKTLQAQKDKRT